MQVGSRVTKEPPDYFDGQLVLTWPKKVGTVTRFVYCHGRCHVVVKYDNGNRSMYPIEEVYVLGGGK